MKKLSWFMLAVMVLRLILTACSIEPERIVETVMIKRR
jgi:hypothetical protein